MDLLAHPFITTPASSFPPHKSSLKPLIEFYFKHKAAKQQHTTTTTTHHHHNNNENGVVASAVVSATQSPAPAAANANAANAVISPKIGAVASPGYVCGGEGWE
jgi:hypothetical protein